MLHPKTIRLVSKKGIPLRILSFRPTHPGTMIVKAPSSDRLLLPAIISSTGLSLIVVGSRDDSWSLPMAARTPQRLSEAGVDVRMSPQSFSEHSLNLVVREQDQEHCLKTLRREFESDKQGSAYSLGAKEKVSTISVVGVPTRSENSVVSHTFAALGKLGTEVIAVAQAATEHSVSFCIPEEQVVDTGRLLHRELKLEE